MTRDELVQQIADILRGRNCEEYAESAARAVLDHLESRALLGDPTDEHRWQS